MNTNEEKFTVDTKIRNDEISDREGGKLDKIIFALATGPFILSISFIVGLKEQALVHTWSLLVSWIFLALAIIVHITSFIIVIKKTRKLDKKIAEARGSGNIKALNDYILNSNNMVNVVDWINYISIGLTIIGIIFLTIFASVNINNKNYMTNNKDGKPKKSQVWKHATPVNFLPYTEPKKDPQAEPAKPSQQENNPESQEDKK